MISYKIENKTQNLRNIDLCIKILKKITGIALHKKTNMLYEIFINGEITNVKVGYIEFKPEEYGIGDIFQIKIIDTCCSNFSTSREFTYSGLILDDTEYILKEICSFLNNNIDTYKVL